MNNNQYILSILNKLLDRLAANGSNTYIKYIELCRKDECLGFDAKIDCKRFGYSELQAHKDAQEYLGRYRAINEVLEIINESINEINNSSS